MAEYKKSGGSNETLSKILAISQHAMQSGYWKLNQGQDALDQKAASRPGKRKRTKTCSSKLRKGLNVTVNVDLWFCNDDFCKRKHEGKKRDFFVFLWCWKWSFLFSFKFKRWYFAKKKKNFFCFYWISQFEGHSIQCSKLTVKTMLAIEKAAMF